MLILFYDPGYNIPEEELPKMIDIWLEEEENELRYNAHFYIKKLNKMKKEDIILFPIIAEEKIKSVI